MLSANSAKAQDPSTAQDSTVTYPAEYFAQFNPYSVNDMLQRIPGISLARSGSRSESRGGGRGLGAGGEQVLINGRRIAGKSNEGDSQLSRIPASEVRYIEIIRGTSGELDVRGGAQVVNVVLEKALSSVSFAYEVSTDRALDGSLIPGGKISATGQYGALNYFLSAEREPRYDYRDGFERAFGIDGGLVETVTRDETTRQLANISNSKFLVTNYRLLTLQISTFLGPEMMWNTILTESSLDINPTRLLVKFSNEIRSQAIRAISRLVAITCMFLTTKAGGKLLSLLMKKKTSSHAVVSK